MKEKILLTMFFTCFFVFGNSQEINTLNTTNWNLLRKSGFYQSLTAQAENSPSTHGWYWGINIGYTNNSINSTIPYHYNGQIAFAVNQSAGDPIVYVRSTNETGQGKWAKLLHEQGNHTITGDLSVQNLSSRGQYVQVGTPGVNKLSQLYLHLLKTPGAYGEIAFRYADNTSVEKSMIRSTYTSGGGNIEFMTAPANSNFSFSRMIITPDGKIGINQLNPTSTLDVNGNIKATRLDVKGTIRATDITVETGWADFVFSKDYKLPTLSEVENYILTYSRLPDIPSEQEVRENGVSLGEMQVKLLQKIEELTLYTIEQERKIKDLQIQNEQFKNQEDRIIQLEKKLLGLGQ